MMKASLYKPLWVVLLLWLVGCTAPIPYGGAPVVDRSIRRQPPPPEPSPVEVNPLSRPEPIVPQEHSLPADPTPPPPAGAPAPQPPGQTSQQTNQAVVALLDSAASYVNAGELEKAAAALERALRIEPRNAGIWHDLGQIRLHQRQYEQAESMASKSNSLAGNDRVLQARNWRLIAVARRAMGDMAGADTAEAQAVVSERGVQ